MRFQHLVMTFTGLIELTIVFNLFLDFSNNASKYLANSILLNYIILSIMAIVLISSVIVVHLAERQQSYYLYMLATIFCTFLSAAWLLMFINAFFNDHYKILTPLLLYMASIKFLIAWYLGDAAKESKV